jgi:hypothetical protein
MNNLSNAGKAEKLASDILDLLPETQGGPNIGLTGTVKELAIKSAEEETRRQTASDLAKLKRQEQKKLEAEIRKGEDTAFREERIEAIEALEEVNAGIRDLTRKKMPPAQVRQVAALQGATREDVLKLLSSLNINLNLQLSKSDTANLLACLLTCNESQLDALERNRKVPVVIKTVIKRLKEDAKLGNIDTIERLWDRIFGKANMMLNLPSETTVNGIIPDTPVSREAYMVIREAYLK